MRPGETERADNNPLPAYREKRNKHDGCGGAKRSVYAPIQQSAIARRLVADIGDKRADNEVDAVAEERGEHKILERKSGTQRPADNQARNQEPPAESEGEERQGIASLLIPERRVRIVRACRFRFGIKTRPGLYVFKHP